MVDNLLDFYNPLETSVRLFPATSKLVRADEFN